MAERTERFKAFVKLGDFFREFAAMPTDHPEGDLSEWDPGLQRFYEKARQASVQNGWFTPENIRHALAAWGEALRESELERWLAAYALPDIRPKTVAIIMAGNIPLVGFHDFLSVLITGNRALVKLSSNDRVLLPEVASLLCGYCPSLEEAIAFADGPMKGYEAVIATGSDNTARYFSYYFGQKPHIIRNNRKSTAILSGDETADELQALGTDIFTYFGLGCRNVSKLYVPEQYDFADFFDAIKGFSGLLNHRKYGNNYDYNKAVYLMSGFPILDNGFVLLKEDSSYSSPIGTLFYERYTRRDRLDKQLLAERDRLQCIVGRKHGGGEIPFGQTQQPALWEYADQIDTVEFLLKT